MIAPGIPRARRRDFSFPSLPSPPQSLLTTLMPEHQPAALLRPDRPPRIDSHRLLSRSKP
eukprot:144727-Rhodomonas_salina.2